MDHHGLKRAYKGLREKSIGYTLLELLTVLVIILILASIGIFAYNRAIAYAKGTVCQTNLRALEAAIELYTLESDALPASLGRLKLEHLKKGYAKAMADKKWLKKLSFALVKLDSSDQAYAQFLTPENLETYGGSRDVFHCPTDRNGGASYGINGNLVGKQWSTIDRHEIVIGDSDYYVFTSIGQLKRRHRHKAFALNRGGTLLEVGKDKIVPLGGNDSETPLEDIIWDDDEEYTPSGREDDTHGSSGEGSQGGGKGDSASGGKGGSKGGGKGGTPNDPVGGPQDAKSQGKAGANFPSDLDGVVQYFDDFRNNNMNTPIADKAEDVRNNLMVAVLELSKTPPDISAAQGSIEGAEGDLQAMINDGLINQATGSALIDLFRDISSQLNGNKGRKGSRGEDDDEDDDGDDDGEFEGDDD